MGVLRQAHNARQQVLDAPFQVGLLLLRLEQLLLQEAGRHKAALR
jgi:hypothetical protein